MRAEAQAEKKALIDQLSKPSGISEEEAIRRGIAIIERAMHSRMTEVEVFRFPYQLCTDKGRAIIQQEPAGKRHSPARRRKSINYGRSTFGRAATS
jgi:hypothetical protein